MSLGLQVFFTGVVAMGLAICVAVVSGNPSEVPEPVKWGVVVLFFGGGLACAAGALIAIWSAA
jgi:hypothetical protein